MKRRTVTPERGIVCAAQFTAPEFRFLTNALAAYADSLWAAGGCGWETERAARLLSDKLHRAITTADAAASENDLFQAETKFWGLAGADVPGNPPEGESEGAGGC